MRKSLVITVLILIPVGFAQAQIPTAERDALIAFYNSTNGTSWDTSSWPPSCTEWLGAVGTECSWCGVTCAVGHVDILSASDPNLYGPLPPELENLSNLRRFYVRFSKLSGTLPAWLGNLSNLEYLYLDSNWLTGSIPPELANLSNLEILKLDANQLDGAIPTELSTMPSLRGLDLGFNDLSGVIPPELSNVSMLQELNLQFNDLTGGIPPELENLTQLQYLKLSGNDLEGEIPPELGNLGPLRQLQLAQNQLYGEIPLELGDNTNLQWLDLSYNRLTGSIPTELENLASLEVLLLIDNRLTGNIPSELQHLTVLRRLELSDNLLRGPIPPELANLTALGYLYLDSNQLTGGIPADFGDLTNMRRMYLNSNRLSGAIPSDLGDLTAVGMSSGFDLRWNALHSDDATLLTFIDNRQVGGDCLEEQTIAPDNPSFSRVGDRTVWLSWDAVSYQADPGGYEVFSSPTGSGIWTSGGWTEAKTTTTFPVTGLDPGTTYDLAVVTRTDPHADNFNLVNSDLSTEVMTSTASTGCAQPVIDIAGAGMGPFTLSLTESYGSYTWSTAETTASIVAGPPYGQWYWVTVTSTGPCEETTAVLVDPEISADGFEAGDTADWSSAVP